ncbi:MAG: hypothetical protein NT069_25165 [Planctomycetota bacterium]|nr:hypothetical protein [Planctomycetota bacterium]
MILRYTQAGGTNETLPEKLKDTTRMFQIERSADRVQVGFSNLVVVFELTGDRWSHSLEQIGGGSSRLCSLEGGADDAEPCSPAFQDLWFEPMGTDTCEFQMMGQAGQAIFSAAIRLDAQSGKVDFEICARRKKPAARVGMTSTYQIVSGPHGAGGGSNAGCDVWQIESLPVPGNEVSVTPPVIATEDGRIVAGYCEQTGCEPSESLKQIRWRYQILARPQA